MSAPRQNEDRQRWLRGEPPGDGADDFARQAARGREELGSEAEAQELLGELDSLFEERFAGTRAQEGAAAGAKSVAKVRSLRQYYAIAASLLLLVATGYWWATRQPVFDAEATYAAAFSPYANELSGRTMGEVDPADTLAPTLRAALLAYDRREYATAADSFAVQLIQAPAAAPTLYYGISLLAAGRTADARKVLAPLRTDANYGDPARWYHALALVRQPDLTAARDALNAIATDETSRFRTQAANLLTTLP
ncbi:MAG: hypothetical protein AAFZ52_14765 [Bacteroidota bacterium]